jgi:hypothetical protein
LASSAGDSPAVPGRWYAPLREHADLFKTFAKITTGQDLFEFANKYGNLTAHCNWERWAEEIAAMQQALTIWEACDPLDAAVLCSHFLWQTDDNGKQCVLYDSYGGNSSDCGSAERVTMVIGSETSPDGRWEALARKDVLVAAQLYLLQVINDRLNPHATRTHVWDAEEQRSVTVFMPRNLLGAIWMQFEHFVTGDNKLVSCPVCGSWFEVSRTAGRSDKEYCSDSCRSKALRQSHAALTMPNPVPSNGQPKSRQTATAPRA